MGKGDNKKKKKGRFRGRAPRGSINKDNDQKDENVNNFNNFNVLFTNVDTLNFEKLQELHVRLDAMENKPILLALSETNPKSLRYERIMAEYNLDGYDLLPLNMGKEEPGRGMIMYIKTGLTYSPVNMKTNFCESLSVEIDINKSDKLLVTSIYRSPRFSKEECINLNNLFKEISERQCSHTLIMGDFNFPGINWTNWTTETGIGDSKYEFIETVRDCYFYQHIQEPTRGRGSNTPSCIDLIFSNEEGMTLTWIRPYARVIILLFYLRLTPMLVAMVHIRRDINTIRVIM